MALHVVIMAGGKGERLWPLSREKRPKQLISLDGKSTMLRKTFERISPIVSPSQTYIVTNREILDTVIKEVPEVPRKNILAEPVAKNTAPCIGYAAMVISKDDPRGVMVVLPSDHVIADEQRFRDAISFGVSALDKYPELLITLGMIPNYPETGYGYIALTKRIYKKDSFVLHRVEAFHEKPDRRLAASYIRKGYLWNSGMFMWRVDTIQKAFEKHLPGIYKGLKEVLSSKKAGEDNLTKFYEGVDAISIDYGIMEKAKEVAVIPVEFGWNDVGSWDALGRLLPADGKGNTVHGDVVLDDAWNNVAWSTGKKIVLMGVNNTVVVDGEDAILVCPRGRSQDINKLLKKIKQSDL